MFNDAHVVTFSPYANFHPDWSINSLLAMEQLPVGVTMKTPTPIATPTHVW